MSNYRVVADTNIFISAQLSSNERSPNKEFFDHFREKAFTLLFSDDCMVEYIRKLEENKIPRGTIVELVSLLFVLGEEVKIEYFHFPHYPPDQDDIAFLLCALNGHASHLVTYDHHLLGLSYAYRDHFKICETIPFLTEIRTLK